MLMSARKTWKKEKKERESQRKQYKKEEKISGGEMKKELNSSACPHK